MLVQDTERAGDDVRRSLARAQPRLLGRLEAVPLRLPFVDRERAISLGEAVEMSHREAHLAQAGQQRGRRRRPARVHVNLAIQDPGRGVFGDHGQHGRRGAEMSDPLGTQQAPDLGRIHRPQAHVRAARRGDGPGEAPAIAVEHRQGPQVLRARPEAGVVCHCRGLKVRTPMVVHHALRAPRRPAGVVDRQELALVDRPGAHPGGIGAVDPRLVGVTGSAGDEARQVQLFGQVASVIGELVRRHQQRRARMIDDLRHFRGREPDVNRHQRGPQRRHRVVQFQHHVAVGAQGRDPVLVAHALGGQGACEPPAAIGHVPVGEPAFPVDDRDPVREDRGRAVEEGGGRQRGEGELCHLVPLSRAKLIMPDHCH